jgi:hypothetical protein
MSLIEGLVQIPYLMRPGLKRLDKPYRLTPETDEAYELKRQRQHNPIFYAWEDEVLYAQTFAHLCRHMGDDWNNRTNRLSLGALSHEMREDVVVMNKDGVFELLIVNHPSGWAPEEHHGKTFAEVHMRLPDAELIQRASEHFVKLVTGGDTWQRTVWTLSPTDDLCRHPKLKASQSDWSNTKQVYLRWEEQTFVPFVPGERVIFLIKVQTMPLADACENYDDIVRVNASLETMSDAVKAYKGLDHPRLQELVRQVMDSKFANGI